jgi:hypothetical protein
MKYLAVALFALSAPIALLMRFSGTCTGGDAKMQGYVFSLFLAFIAVAIISFPSNRPLPMASFLCLVTFAIWEIGFALKFYIGTTFLRKTACDVLTNSDGYQADGNEQSYGLIIAAYAILLLFAVTLDIGTRLKSR